jgi:hypothetical protein
MPIMLKLKALTGPLELGDASLCGVAIRIESTCPELVDDLTQLWGEFFVLGADVAPPQAPVVALRFESARPAPWISPGMQTVCETPDLSVIKTDTGFRLACHGSTLELDLGCSRGAGVLTDRFERLPAHYQREFFLLAFLMLFRRHGLYGLHSSAVARGDLACLIVGPSGHGKTTLALALVREGWRYLSDDVLVLQSRSDGVAARAMRRGFSCTPETARLFPELTATGPARLDMFDGKQLLDVAAVYPGRFADQCRPRLLLFPQIAGGRRSRLVPLNDSQAMLALIRQSPGIMVDRPAVQAQLGVLKRLVGQAHKYRILLGSDVYEDSAAVSGLLSAVR